MRDEPPWGLTGVCALFPVAHPLHRPATPAEHPTSRAVTWEGYVYCGEHLDHNVGAPPLQEAMWGGVRRAGLSLRYTLGRGEVLQEGAAMAVSVFDIWNEVDEFLTSTPTPSEILAFRPSPGAQERLRRLLDARASGALTTEEEAELNETLAVEHFMRRLKIRALAKVRA
jgi:hypothetical protein